MSNKEEITSITMQISKTDSKTMQLKNWLAYKTITDPSLLFGKTAFKDSRVSVSMIRDMLANGWTNEDVKHGYDYLGLTDEDLEYVRRYNGK